tara:strand:+ start:80 stop:439 length:360 start_codon:yes stop_codon:yes gene_type:complete
MINIYVGNIPYSLRSQSLREIFEEFGEVLSAEIIFDRQKRRSKGYGFVEMANEQDGLEAIEELDGEEIEGRRLRVREAQGKAKGPRTHRDSSNYDGNRTGKPRDRGILSFLKRLLGRRG